MSGALDISATFTHPQLYYIITATLKKISRNVRMRSAGASR